MDTVQECSCIEKGIDGTFDHTSPSDRILRIKHGGEIKFRPCSNHLSAYIESNLFEDVNA